MIMWRSYVKKKNKMNTKAIYFNTTHTHTLSILFDTHLSAAVVTLITLETLLILVSLLVLDESISLMEHSITITAFLPRLNK